MRSNPLEASPDELSILKQELQSILREKNLLKARIARLEDSASRDASAASPAAKPPKTIVTELEQAEQYNATRRSEIELILNSDLVANVIENEQEAIILYEELQRCQQVRKESEAMLGDLTREFDAMHHKFSRETMQHNEELIRSLEDQIAAQERLTEEAAEAVRQRQRSFRGDSVDKARARLSQRISTLQAQIERDEAEIEMLDAQIAERVMEIEEEQEKCETED
jgi:predicted RNase H-like nuclease (RuvC/YqgF family)